MNNLSFLISIFLCISCHPQKSEHPLTNTISTAIEVIRDAPSLSTSMTTPGNISETYKAFITLKSECDEGTIRLLMKNSDRSVTKAYCLLYLAEKNLLTPKDFTTKLNGDFPVQNYGVLIKITPENFFNILRDHHSRKAFTQ